jgi:hypothetical protein
MNFDCVGRKPDGEMYMKFHIPFNPTEKIQLLQRWILVQSFAYYELNENIASDFQYDANAIQLSELKKQYPEEFKRSRYFDYFHDYCSDDDNGHYTSGFDLLERVRKNDEQLYRYLHMDAAMALDQKQKRGVEG